MEDILKLLAEGSIDADEAKKQLRLFALEKTEKACLDLGRACRKGVPEAVLAEWKKPKDAAKLALDITKKCGICLVTRTNEEVIEEINKISKGFITEPNTTARTVVIKKQDYKNSCAGTVGVIAAGTADIPVAEEAAVAAEVMGCRVIKAYDVGVAGIHRLFEPLAEMYENGAGAIVVAAGMDGALPSVVSGLVDVPVIGVPTSVGYGFGKGGVGALTSMLQTCSPGLAVVNIDNGFGAGVFAAMIVKKR